MSTRVNNSSLNLHVWKKWRTIWTIVFITGLVIIVRDTGSAESNPVGLGQLHRIAGITILGIIVMRFFINCANIPFKSIFFMWTLFALWQVATALWSTFPAWTLYRSLEYLVMVWITAYCANTCKDSDVLYFKWVELIWLFIGLLVLSVWVSVIFAPYSALSYANGIIPFSINGRFPRINSNSVSFYSGVVGIVSFVRMMHFPHRKWKVIFLLAVVTMILSQGRSGIGGFFLGIVVSMLMLRRYDILVVLGVLVSGLILYYAVDQIFWEYFRRGQTERQFWLLSGRVNIWEYTYNNFIINRPLTGHGAYAAGRFLVLKDYVGWSSLHSTWVEMVVGNGIPATILFSLIVAYSWIVILQHCYRNHRVVNNHYFIEILSVYTSQIFRSFFSTYFLTHNDIIFFLVMGSTFYIIKNRNNT